MKNCLYILLIAMLFSSCKTVKVIDDVHYKTNYAKTLGSFAKQKSFLVESDFNSVLFPKYKTKIKLSVSKSFFTKKMYKQYVLSEMHQNKKLNLSYNDTIKNKSYYLKLDIVDREELVKNLNFPYNKSAKSYLKDNSKAQLIVSVSVLFESSILKKLINSEELYLVNNSNKNYQIELYDSGILKETVSLKDALFLSYNLASPCWKQNNRLSLDIIDVVDKGNKCSNKSYIYSRRAHKRINYFKL